MDLIKNGAFRNITLFCMLSKKVLPDDLFIDQMIVESMREEKLKMQQIKHSKKQLNSSFDVIQHEAATSVNSARESKHQNMELKLNQSSLTSSSASRIQNSSQQPESPQQIGQFNKGISLVNYRESEDTSNSNHSN